MQFPNIDRLILSCVLSLVCLSCGGSMSDPKGMGDPQDSDAFETNLVRIVALDASGRAAFPNIGMDMLAAGEVEVEEEEQNEVKVEVTGAMPNMTYSVEFCSFATGTGGCFAVGSLKTDNNGDAEVQLQFPQHGIFAGVFVLTRNNQSQFVSGFAAPASGGRQVEDDQEQEHEEAFEADLQRVGMVNAGLGPGFGPTGNDPLISGRVEVKGEGEGGGENEGKGPVEVTAAGAVANATYMVEFCRFGVGPNGCVSVGSLVTDMQGNAQAELAFPLTGTFDGIFVITRNVSGRDENEFVTGFVR
jgi:hypothetical protein